MKNITRLLAVAILTMASYVTLSSQVTAPLDDGGYLVRIKESTGLMDNSGYPGGTNPNVGGWYPQGSAFQRWIISQVADGYYQIRSVLADSAIVTVDGSSDDDEANIIQASWEDSDYQKWEIQDLENGYHKVISKGSSKAWHALNPNNPDHAIARNIVQIGSFDTDLQEFEFIATADSVPGGPYESSKSYVIASECTQLVMTEDPLVQDTGNVVQRPYTEESSQKWQLDWVEDVTIEDVTTKYFKITNRGSELVMTLADTAVKDGVSVITEPWSEDAVMQKYQLWGIEPVVGVADQNQVNVFSRMNGGRTIEIQGGPQWNVGQNLATWFRFANTQEWERWQRWRFVMIDAIPLSSPQDEQSISVLKVYPNPASEYCRIDVLASNGTGSVELFDLTGKQVRHMPYGFFEGHNEIIYNLNGVMGGLYFIRINLPDGNNMMSKILVN
jgi:hypothetical protein